MGAENSSIVVNDLNHGKVKDANYNNAPRLKKAIHMEKDNSNTYGAIKKASNSTSYTEERETPRHTLQEKTSEFHKLCCLGAPSAMQSMREGNSK